MRLKVLFNPFTSSSVAHMVRCFAIADEMKKRGYEFYFTSSKSKKDFIEKYGYKVIMTYPDVNINDPKDQSVNFLKDYHDEFVEWFKAEIKATRLLKPDVVIVAPAIFGPHVYYATKTPLISIIDVQYLGTECKGLMGISKCTDKLIDRFLTTILRPVFDKKFTRIYLKEVMNIYKDLGLRNDIKSRDELYNPMAVLIPSDNYTQPMRMDRKDTEYIGPLFWDGFERMNTDISEEKIKKFKKNKKLIYLMFGGSLFDKDIYNKIINTLMELKQKLIVCIGPNFKRGEFRNDNNDLMIRTLVPGMKLSRLSDIIVNTGSQGSVMQGLWWGKPQVTVPVIMDQAFYSNRLEEMGLGINTNHVSLLKFSKRESFSKLPNDISEKIILGVKQIIKNDKYKKNALEFRKVLRKYNDAPKKAVNFIENYIK